MRKNLNVIAAYSIMMSLIILVGIFQSWNIALSIFNLCLISAVMTMGANIQWGYAGLINFGIMGYTALGGLAAVLISVDPVQDAWSVGGFDILISLLIIVGMILAIRFVLKRYVKSKIRTYSIAGIIVVGTVPRIPPIMPPHFSIATVTKMATKPANAAKKSVDNIRLNDLNWISIVLGLRLPKTSLFRHRQKWH